MADLTEPAACCSPADQASCCEPDAKADCCTARAVTCGCGVAPPDGVIRERASARQRLSA